MTTRHDRVGDIIVKLKNEREFVKKDEHLYAIPTRADDLLFRQVFTYYGSDRKPTIFDPATNICIELNDVKFMSMMARTFKNIQDSNTPVTGLIEFQLIYPFMLIINGRFIPWECINLIVSYGKYYFFIHDLPSMDLCRLVRTVDTMNLIILPSHIVYSIGVQSDEYTNLFSFDSMGLYNTANWTHCIYYPNDRAIINKLEGLIPGNVTRLPYESSYRFFNENFFFWYGDGTFCPDGKMDIIGSSIQPAIPEDRDIHCIMIHNSVMSPSIDNLAKVDYEVVAQDVAKVLDNSDILPGYITKLIEPFDFQMDRNLTYEENRAKVIEYILSYRTDLFHALYEFELDFFTLSVDYEWITNHIDSNGYLNISRRSSLGKDYYIIPMVNGMLYSYYKHHKYDANRFICPVAEMDESDTIELLFFRNINSYQFDTVFTEGEYLPLSHRYFNNDTLLFCKETADTYFEFPVDGHQHFPVPYMYETNEAGLRTVKMDPFYYGKTITVAPDTTFKYFGFYVDQEEAQYYKLNLGTNFYYCYDYDRYLVFYNGRRLNNSQYRLTVPCRSTTPFTEFEIYLAVPLSYHDRLDIFYLPDKIRDIDGALVLNSDGSMNLEKSSLEYIAGSGLYTYWVNGKKIPLANLRDVNSITLQLVKNGTSLKNVTITKMGSGIDEVENIYQSIDKPLWDEILELHEAPYDLIDLETVRVTDLEDDFYEGAIPVVSLMWELIREHYMANALVDITTSFIYDYLDQDQTAFDGIDQAGNSIIDAANAERTDNLDVERYYP